MYIHQTTCISSQQTFSNINLEKLNVSENNVLNVIEPKYENIPLNVLRRMGKAVRMGIGAAMPICNANKIDGIIIGTANGGMEDCIKFLNQIKTFEEGKLTPTNFVQGTPNSIASQLGLITKNNGYNITHVHRGLAFENALIDAQMYLSENCDNNILVGGIDEISSYNYNIEKLGGWYKNEKINNTELYNTKTNGTIAGEGVAMFLVNNNPEKAIAKISAIKTFHTNNEIEVAKQLELFLKNNNEQIDVFISGENGDNRLQKYSDICENIVNRHAELISASSFAFKTEIPKQVRNDAKNGDVSIVCFKHFCGEFPTASAVSLWLACEFIKSKNIPNHFIKNSVNEASFNKILIYNNYKGEQHSFVLLKNIIK